jgi:hypothetical protein
MEKNMSEAADTKAVLELIIGNRIVNPTIQRNLLQNIIKKSFGGELESHNEDLASLKPEEVKAIARDLLQVVDHRTSPISLPSDDVIKDRIGNVFMASVPFKIAVTILGLGAALFGINMGVLTFDTSAANRTKTEAAVAANDAKVAADNAKNAVASAISSMQLDMPRQIAEKINLSDVEPKVASILSEKLSPAIMTLDSKISNVAKSVNEQNVKVEAAERQVNDFQKSVAEINAKVAEAQRLFARLESAAEVVNKTTADQTLARAVWLVLRNDAFFLIGSFAVSLVAFVLALWSFRRYSK